MGATLGSGWTVQELIFNAMTSNLPS